MKVAAKKSFDAIKQTALVIYNKINEVVVTPFKSKKNFKEFVNSIKDKFKNLIFRKKE